MAQDSSAEDLSKDEIRMAGRWAEAVDKARVGGMREIGESGQAFFSVRVSAS